MTRTGALVLVHAHPDDEALFTAGITRLNVDHGRRVVLVTCTDGRLGLDDQVRAGNDPRHDATAVAITRAGELATSVELLGVGRHVQLGYHDSGLEGWLEETDPLSFTSADLDATARTLAAIFDEENATVVVTYDEQGYYGHPDHVRAHEVTMAAAQLSRTVTCVFYPVTPRSLLETFLADAKAAGVSLPLWVLDAATGTDDDQIAASLDVTAYADTIRAAIGAHASQVDNADLVTMDEDLFRLLFGHEHYRLGWSRSGPAGATDELFGGP